ncbi:MAG: SDR family oxidoreductase [Aggregatilineales bacterium]
MDLGIKGKIALVAAASKGLGFGTARVLAREGALVSMCSRDRAAIEAAGAKIYAETGSQPLTAACDLRDAKSIQTWIDQTVAQWGRIDAVLVNAGGPPNGLFKDLDDAAWQAAFELTLLSTVRLIRGTIAHMPEGGAILTVTSSSVQEPIERLILSTAMRSGVAGLVKTLADELAPQKIRVNNLLPGRIDTDRVAQIDQNTASKLGITFEQARSQSLQRIPLKRLGSIDEFGAVAAFLLSPAASYLTGASLRVDGGMMRSI